MEKKLFSNSLVLKEALSIPEKIYTFNKNDLNNYKEVVKLINTKKIKYIVTIARGSSDCVALYASYIFAKYLGLPTYSMPPSIITLEKSKFDFSQALILVISQSGISKDLIECEEKTRKMGAKTIIISNNDQSPLIKKANYFFNINAGEERSVAATKTFVLSLLIIIKLVFTSTNKININNSIQKLSEYLLNDSNNQWNANIVDNKINTGFIISRGVGFAISNEMSLKFKELCQELIEPFSSAEVMHGPKSLVQDSFKLFILEMNDKSGLTVQKDSYEITNYTKLIYNISSNNESNTSFFYPRNKITELDSIVLMTKFYPWIINYSLSKGLNPDKPRYLTKITQTY